MISGASGNTLTAGDGGCQLVAGRDQSVTIINGLTPDNLAMLTQMQTLAIREVMSGLASQAQSEAQARMDRFAKNFEDRLERLEDGIESMKDPSFQYLLSRAHLAAAQTADVSDYDMLSELLVTRMTKASSRNSALGIRKAVEVVHEIDAGALSRLTLFHTFDVFSPDFGWGVTVAELVKEFDELFSKILQRIEAIDYDWVEHLSMVGAVRILQLGAFTKTRDLFVRSFDGALCAGIAKGSEAFGRAQAILSEASLPMSALRDNELLADHVRLNIFDLKDLSSHVHVKDVGEILIGDSQRKALADIKALYEKDSSLLNDVKKTFVELVEKYANVKKAMELRDSCKTCFKVTPAGRVLAHVNVRLLDKSLPEMPLVGGLV